MKKAKFALQLFLLAAIIAVAACGKISMPQPIEGSGYPHSYPRQ